MLLADEIRRFYENWREEPVHKTWTHLYRKEFRAETLTGEFIVLNRLRNRLNFSVLKRLCVELLPLHLYQSVLNYAKPWMVSEKSKSYKAYPFHVGEFVVDVDSYLAYQPHSHRTRNDEPCMGCIQNAYDLTLKVIDKLRDARAVGVFSRWYFCWHQLVLE